MKHHYYLPDYHLPPLQGEGRGGVNCASKGRGGVIIPLIRKTEKRLYA